MQISEIDDLIYKLALQNAIKYNGKAKVRPVFGKLFSEGVGLESPISELIKRVAKIVKVVNSLNLMEQKKIIEEKWPKLLAKIKVRNEKMLPPLPNTNKYDQVVTSFSPNPNFVLHLGHSRALILSHDYARMYKGKFYLKFEDTDPRVKKPVPEFYDLIRQDVCWLGCKWDQEIIQSDRIPIYYEFARKLLEAEKAYVCICKSRKITKEDGNLPRKPCPCRNLSSADQLTRWGKMLDGTYREREAIVRIKTDLNHSNPSVRDWVALRIIDEAMYPHPRVGDKYRVWPLYCFANGIDDHLLGITHKVGGKEHIINTIKQRYLFKHLDWNYPEVVSHGRLNVNQAVLSKSKILEGVRKGVFNGFSDPQLATLIALRRRGITAEALRKIVIYLGPKPVDVKLDWTTIYSYNRKTVDPIARRFFFVCNPIPISITNVRKAFVSMVPFHPNYPRSECRRFRIEPVNGVVGLFISKGDVNFLHKGEMVRLMSLFNIKIECVKIKRVEATFHSEPYIQAKKMVMRLVHWVPEGENIKVNVVMPTAKTLEGVGEESLGKVVAGEIVQLTRFGFGRIDKVQNSLVVVCYAHK